MAIGVEFHGDWISFFAGSHLGVFFYPDRLTEKYQMHAQIKTIYIGIDCAIYIEHTMTNSQICNLNAEICLIYLNLSELTIKFRIFGDFQTTFWPITLRLPLWKGVIGLIRGSGKNCRKKHFFLKLMLYQWLRYNTELFSLKIFIEDKFLLQEMSIENKTIILKENGPNFLKKLEKLNTMREGKVKTKRPLQVWHCWVCSK